MYAPLYEFLRDQGGVIGGILAFFAGLLAYSAGREQAIAVNKQNEELKRTERRRLARDGLAAARLIDGVLLGIWEDLSREIAYVANTTSPTINDATERAVWNGIRKPELSTVWEQLGLLDHEIIKKYLDLDRGIVKNYQADFRAPTQRQVNTVLGELRTMQASITFIRQNIESEFDRANKALLI